MWMSSATTCCPHPPGTLNYGQSSVDFGNDSILCELATLLLDATQPHPAQYFWQDGSTQPIYIVRGPGMYSVEVSNRCFTHWDAVNVDYEHCAQELYLPNAFTPNDDGKNPVFLPIFSYPDEIEGYRMEIYNRWGTLVFRTEEKTFGWDGSNAMEGVYAVVIHYKSRGEKAKTVSSSVTLVR